MTPKYVVLHVYKAFDVLTTVYNIMSLEFVTPQYRTLGNATAYNSITNRNLKICVTFYGIQKKYSYLKSMNTLKMCSDWDITMDIL